ncbi:hypothetical protein DFJ63DRAFT_314427 [Scheffersomyces coipomensis]|uniref:uncharacterized protein n=1 Tax=Scheffersomyces coipomensis TaxID=1788519 RepID=UPI00315CFC83
MLDRSIDTTDIRDVTCYVLEKLFIRFSINPRLPWVSVPDEFRGPLVIVIRHETPFYDLSKEEDKEERKPLPFKYANIEPGALLLTDNLDFVREKVYEVYYDALNSFLLADFDKEEEHEVYYDATTSLLLTCNPDFDIEEEHEVYHDAPESFDDDSFYEGKLTLEDTDLIEDVYKTIPDFFYLHLDNISIASKSSYVCTNFRFEFYLGNHPDDEYLIRKHCKFLHEFQLQYRNFNITTVIYVGLPYSSSLMRELEVIQENAQSIYGPGDISRQFKIVTVMLNPKLKNNHFISQYLEEEITEWIENLE